MKGDEAAPTGNEFESFCEQLDSFLEGYFWALGLKEVPAYAQGDFFYERTQVIHFKKPSHLTAKLIRALQKWLSAPRRNKWRVVIPRPNDRSIVVYHDMIALSPHVRSLKQAIS